MVFKSAKFLCATVLMSGALFASTQQTLSVTVAAVTDISLGAFSSGSSSISIDTGSVVAGQLPDPATAVQAYTVSTNANEAKKLTAEISSSLPPTGSQLSVDLTVPGGESATGSTGTILTASAQDVVTNIQQTSFTGDITYSFEITDATTASFNSTGVDVTFTLVNSV